MGTPKTGSKKQEQDGNRKSQVNGRQNPKESKTKTQKTQKPADQKKSPILDVAAGVEGMTAPPADMGPTREGEGEEEDVEEVGEEGEEDEEPHYNPWKRVVTSPPRPSAAEQAARNYGTRRARPETSRSFKKAGKSRQSKQSAKAAAGGSSRRKSSKGRQVSPAKKSGKGRQRSPDDEGGDKEDEKPTTEVKQFAFPYYKILSGASVAPVRMLPQKIVIKPSCEPDSRPGHWAAGLFQNTKMSVKLRLLRLFLVWLFFRMLNRQAMWLSEKLDLGQPDPADIQKPPPSGPGEKYIRVFHEGKPNPFHMKFTPDMDPKDGFRPPPS